MRMVAQRAWPGPARCNGRHGGGPVPWEPYSPGPRGAPLPIRNPSPFVPHPAASHLDLDLLSSPIGSRLLSRLLRRRRRGPDGPRLTDDVVCRPAWTSIPPSLSPPLSSPRPPSLTLIPFGGPRSSAPAASLVLRLRKVSVACRCRVVVEEPEASSGRRRGAELLGLVVGVEFMELDPAAKEEERRLEDHNEAQDARAFMGLAPARHGPWWHAVLPCRHGTIMAWSCRAWAGWLARGPTRHDP
ncbi:LOW QUALITY PROTEIN: hypothetical protein U9M48_002422, partial [Paspalum notatum var. saurae]